MGLLREKGHFRNSWFWQILSAAGSLISMAIIVILLAIYNNKPLFDKSGITLNAIIAVFSTASKALLAFTVAGCLGQSKWIWASWQHRHVKDLNNIDFASRGPLGSVNLLWSPVARSFISFGAVITILSIATDPLVQLVIGTDVRTVYQDSPLAQIPYAKRYSRGRLDIYRNSERM